MPDGCDTEPPRSDHCRAGPRFPTLAPVGAWWGMPLAAGMLVLAGAGCSGGGDASADASTTVPRAVGSTVPSTTVPAPTSTTTVPLYSFDGSVPPPELVTTGDDFEAIYRTIDAYSRWIGAHYPDVNVIGKIAAFGSSSYQAYEESVGTLARENLRKYEEGGEVLAVEVLDRVQSFVTLRVSYAPETVTLVSEDGVRDRRTRDERAYIVLLATSGQGWRLASLSIVSDAAVEL